MSFVSALADWPSTGADALALQKVLRAQLQLADDFGVLETVAGLDVSYDVARNISRAVVVSMRLADLAPLETSVAYAPTPFPYIPGLLSFREIPVLLKALDGLRATPDCLMVDGHGIAHPRRLGIAAHLGLLTGLPSLGVAKSRLTGAYDEPGAEKGDHAPLLQRGERIGTVLRSKPRTNVLFISPGNRMGHETALALTLRCLTRYRLPEPTRLADKISKNLAEDGALALPAP